MARYIEGGWVGGWMGGALASPGTKHAPPFHISRRSLLFWLTHSVSVCLALLQPWAWGHVAAYRTERRPRRRRKAKLRFLGNADRYTPRHTSAKLAGGTSSSASVAAAAAAAAAAAVVVVEGPVPRPG
jgi:hypothetical protein